MDSAGGHNPESFIYPKLESPDQPFKTRKRRIGRRNAEAEKAFACLVIYAVGPVIHFVFRTLVEVIGTP